MILHLIATICVLLWILKMDAGWLRLHIHMFCCMFGYAYTPSKRVSAVLAAAIFYIVYGLIIER